MEPKDQEQELDPDILTKLKEFKGVSTLKKIALNILVKMTSDTGDVEGLRAMFQKIDKDQTGYISAHELRDALNEANVKYHEEDLDKIISEIDYHGHNQINYSEFLAATMSIKKILTSDRLYAMFRQFDADGSGYITPQDIAEAMQKLGHKISGEDIHDIMKKHAVEKEDRISFEEFKKIFEGLQ